ncbi:expansin-like B1 [Gossypium australe]|uniref:Expansin-like B1 n=1 Tax=Gossypium australe TaxID=47621 RepID=A0A5B6VJ91_9ROSI|nr:expansin-like B1 [Gossypium australe]
MLYQAGKSDILSVDIWQQGKWVEMRRSFGAVFDMPNPPLGAISLGSKCRTIPASNGQRLLFLVIGKLELLMIPIFSFSKPQFSTMVASFLLLRQ